MERFETEKRILDENINKLITSDLWKKEDKKKAATTTEEEGVKIKEEGKESKE
mgnify:FL=1